MTMRLSEAIRLGALLKPQGFGPQFIDPAGDEVCAFGAALLSVGARRGADDVVWFNAVQRHWRWTRDTCAACPVCDIENVVMSVVWHLNDTHRWTRERIAEWVATIEPTPTVEPTAPEPQKAATPS